MKGQILWKAFFEDCIVLFVVAAIVLVIAVGVYGIVVVIGVVVVA